MLVLRYIAILLGFSGLVYLSTYLLQDNIVGPCAPSTVIGRCYHTTEEVCDVIWSNAERTCNQWIKKFTFEPGRLTSPIIDKCKRAEVDKILKASLKSTGECEEYRKDLDDWKRQNY